MRVRLGTVLLAFSFCGIADDGATVNSVVAAVRASIARKSKDAGTARSLDKMKMAQHLEDRVIEILGVRARDCKPWAHSSACAMRRVFCRRRPALLRE